MAKKKSKIKEYCESESLILKKTMEDDGISFIAHCFADLCKSHSDANNKPLIHSSFLVNDSND